MGAQTNTTSGGPPPCHHYSHGAALWPRPAGRLGRHARPGGRVGLGEAKCHGRHTEGDRIAEIVVHIAFNAGFHTGEEP